MATVTQSDDYVTKPVTAWGSFRRGLRTNGIPWLFIIPSIIVMLFITFTPQAYQIVIAFRDFQAQNLAGASAPFLALDNFRRVITSEVNVVNYNFFPLLGFNIVWTVVNVALHVGIGLAVALALNSEQVIGRRIYRAIFVLPWALPGYITALIWNNLWQQNNGGINLLFESINNNLGTDLPTRTAWLTNLTPPIDLRAIVPFAVVVICALLVIYLVRRALKGELKEEVPANAPPIVTPADVVGLIAASALAIAFFFLPWINVNDQSLSAFGILWNYAAQAGTINQEALLIMFFATMIAFVSAVFGLLNSGSRNITPILLTLAGIVGVVYYVMYFTSVADYPRGGVDAMGIAFWIGAIASIALILQIFIPRKHEKTAATIRLSVGKTVFTVGAIALIGLAGVGTLMDMINNGGQSSNAVVQLFDRAGAPMLAFYAVLIANVWLGWPFMMVVATGALQSIPPDLYEAADVDGASKWKQFTSITLPLLRPAMVPAIMLGTVWTFNQFNVIFFITAGGPRNQTDLLVTQSYKLIQQEQQYGVAAAFSIVVFFILLVITLLQNRVTQATKSYDEA